MKLIILTAIKEWVIKIRGMDIWKMIAEKAGVGIEVFNNQDSFMSDARFGSFINSLLTILLIDLEEFKAQFIGNYWMTEFAPRVYQSYLKKITTTKVFLTNIIKLNNDICKLLPNTYISRIDMQEMNESTLTLMYASEKSLVDIVGLLRGASTFFNDTYTIKKINTHSSEIRFERK